jgi:hypothetical protein
VVVACLKILYQHLPAVTMKKMEDLLPDRQTLGQNLEHCSESVSEQALQYHLYQKTQTYHFSGIRIADF